MPIVSVFVVIRGHVRTGRRLPLLHTTQFLFQVIYLLLHDLIVVSSLGYAIAHLGVAFTRLGGIHAPLSIPFILLILFETLWVLFLGNLLDAGFSSVDLILPCLIVVLTNMQVLLTDGANCRDWV